MVCTYEKICYRWVYGLYVRENKLQVGIGFVGIGFVRTRKYATGWYRFCTYENKYATCWYRVVVCT